MKPQSAFRAAAILAMAAGFSFTAAARTSDSEQLSIYVNQARVHALQIVDDLALLQAYSKAGIPWQVHFARLQKVEDEVMALARDNEHLYALSGSATNDQLFAMDRSSQLTQRLAVRVKESLRYLNYHSATVNMQPFTARINYEYANAKEILTVLR